MRGAKWLGGAVAGKRVVVLGGGLGGVAAAGRLRKLLGREHTVTLIDRNVWHCFSPSYTWLALGWRSTNRITRDLRSLSRKGIEFVCGEIVAINLQERVVQLPEAQIPFDYLIVSLGTEYGTGGIDGLGRAWTNYSLEGAEGLQEELPGFSEGRVVLLVSGLPYRAPTTPYETALLLDYFFWQKRVRDKVAIHIYTPEALPLPFAGQEIGERLVEMLAQRNIIFSHHRQVTSVDADNRRVHFLDGAEATYDLLIATPLQTAPRVVRESGLTGNEGAWVPVERETLATRFDNVYAIGDITTLPMANGLMLPKLGTLAHAQAEVVALNIAMEINGSGEQWAFSGEGSTFLDIGYQKGMRLRGKFFTEPEPQVTLDNPSHTWHWARRGYEWRWLRRWF